jgi:predicted acylesterase/phospholipase RssA
MSQRRTAFVLAGGGSLGALQVGMPAEILEAGSDRTSLSTPQRVQSTALFSPTASRKR